MGYKEDEENYYMMMRTNVQEAVTEWRLGSIHIVFRLKIWEQYRI